MFESIVTTFNKILKIMKEEIKNYEDDNKNIYELELKREYNSKSYLPYKGTVLTYKIDDSVILQFVD